MASAGAFSRAHLLMQRGEPLLQLLVDGRGLKVPGHVEEVLKAVKSLKALKKAA